MARPADGVEALASLGRVAGDAMVPSIVSINCRSTLASCSGDITKWSRSSVVRLRTEPVEEETVEVG
eukprot:5329219-Pleurochrysis_carterae.AAC.1